MHHSNKTIETERLFLRPLNIFDFHNFKQLDMDPEVRSFFPEGPLSIDQVLPELERYIYEWETLGFGIFAVIEKASHQFIGRAGFAQLDSGIVEMGYLFFKECWGKGFATEVAIAILKWAETNVPIDRIVGFAPKKHIASWKVLEKIGMTFYKTDFYQDIECVYYYKKMLGCKTPS